MLFRSWATRAECERHGVPFVDRTPPAATPAYPVDAAGRPLWVRITGPEGKTEPYATVGRAYRVLRWHPYEGGGPVIKSNCDCDWNCFSAEASGGQGARPTWEPCAAPTDAVTPAANPTATWDAAHGLLAVRLAMKGTPVGRTAIVTEDPFVAVDYDIHGAVHSVEFHAPSVTPAAALTEEERGAALKSLLMAVREAVDGSLDMEELGIALNKYEKGGAS